MGRNDPPFCYIIYNKSNKRIGEETEGAVTTISKLRDTIKEATKVESNDFEGFDILNDAGNYKSTYEILLGISNIYKEIVKSDKELGQNKANLLLETVANFHATIHRNMYLERI